MISAIGDRHLVGNEAVGALQIRPIMVREVNRICKRIGSDQRFTLKDRFDRDKSIHMFMIWKKFHHKNSILNKLLEVGMVVLEDLNQVEQLNIGIK